MQDNHARASRRAVIAGALALGAAAPLIRRAAAQPAQGVSPQLAELYEKAKPEGEVTIWAPGSPSVAWIPAEFAKRFPGIKVTWLGDQQASSRLIAEQRAGRHATDVWTFSLGGTLEVQKRGLLEKYDWRQFGAQDRDIFWDGEAVCNHNFVYAPLYAKAKLTKEQVPNQWDGLLDAKWTDKLMSGNFLLPRLGGYLAIEWGLERTQTWIKTLIDQRKLMITTADVSTFFKSGERQLAVAESVSGAFLMNKDGLNVGYQIMEMVPATQFVLGQVTKAPHPNAARLLIAWLISPEAKMLYETLAGQADIRANSNSPLAQEIKAAGAKVIYEDVETMNQRAEYYRKLMSIVRGQG
ncbi:MAG: ABC transporter substrate-binding protein [Reyranella sp.]